MSTGFCVEARRGEANQKKEGFFKQQVNLAAVSGSIYVPRPREQRRALMSFWPVLHRLTYVTSCSSCHRLHRGRCYNRLKGRKKNLLISLVLVLTSYQH